MPGNKTIKFSAITRAGYEYQDLIGIELLIRHYRDPNLFEWVQIESDDPDVKALDDVVAKRQDGSVEYVQVKFTVDPAEYALDWDFLLKKKEHGTSMLAKWASSLRRARTNGTIHSAQLKTNRIPSADFSKCLISTFVDLSKVATDTLNKIETECGGTAETAEFFATFAFTASLPDLDRLEASIRDQLVPTDTNMAGWLLLRHEVTRWAILQRMPPPDGRIFRDHIVRLISQKRPQPIRQDFFIPDGYAPPSDNLHKRMERRIADPATPLTVLWGTPGRGKSTYLSYLASELQAKDEAVIRHHYFLSSEDSSANRASFVDIAASLYEQLFTHYCEFTAGITDDADNLNPGLGVVAENLAQEGKRLYLIVDGLDHVYRDTARVDQLNHLFNALFPLPPNLTLIVGTQRVADSQLPSKLLINLKEEDWIEIPRMDEIAVHHWFKGQDKARPILLRWDDRRDEEINKIGAAFFTISHGHPLHLIYAFEGLVRSGLPMDEDTVLALPPCPDGDIRSYYNGLWQRIGEAARAILHMLAGSDFFWPSAGIRKCIGDYGEIAFLLEPNNSGMKPFHGSIFAWVRQREDHAESYEALLPKIVQWLEKDAPEYWRWGWLWLTQASAGEPGPLLAGTTREWAVGSLASGWPEMQIKNILTAAENKTFAAGDLPATVRLRALKTRVSNAREYQAWDFGAFRSAALSIADNRQQALNLLDDLQALRDDELAALARYGPAALRKELVDGCMRELRRRINTWTVLRHRTADDFSKLSDAALQVGALAGVARVPDVMGFLKGYREPSSHILRYIGYLAQARDVGALDEVHALLKGGQWATHRRKIQEHILRASMFVGADPLQRLKRGCFKHSPMVAAWLCRVAAGTRCDVHLPQISPDLVLKRDTPAESVDLEHFLVEAFWTALRTNILAIGEFSSIYPPLNRGNLGFIDDALDCLERCAAELASDTMPWRYSTPFLSAAGLPSVPFKGGNDTERARYVGFRRALNSIALDVHLMGLPDKNAPEITAAEFEIAQASVHWVEEVWVDENAEDRSRYLSSDAASKLLDDVARTLSSKFSEFNERADRWTKYAALAQLYQVGDAKSLLLRASSCLLGYGYRKDPFVFEALDSIRDIHRVDPSETLSWIERVTPVIDRITDFTDGDGTRHARTKLIKIVAETQPLLLPKFYEHHIDEDDWSYADECVKAFISVADLSSPEGAALVGTLLDYTTLDALKDRANTDQFAKHLLDKQTSFLGSFPPAKERDYSTPDRDLNDARKKVVSQDPSAFAANDFAGVAKAVGDPDFHYSMREDFLVRWLLHWHGKGKTRAAIASVRAHFKSEQRTHDVEELLNTVFEVSLEAEGKDAAYPWLVMAHIRRHGWQDYTSYEEVEKRLKAAASIYPERWMDFIRDTSEPMELYARRGYGFSIGFHHLVVFLLLAGQTKVAKKVTAEFVATLLKETEDLPIEEAAWLR